MGESIIVNARLTVDGPTRRRRFLIAAGLSALAGIGSAACERKTPAPPIETAENTIGPAAIDASLDAAEQYLTAGNTANAESIIVGLLARAPQDHRAHELYGRVLYLKSFEASTRGDEAAAAQYVTDAYGQYQLSVTGAETAGGNPHMLAGLHQSAGEIASAAGRPDEALEHFREAGRLDPGAAKAPLYEAQILIGLGRPGDAQQALQRVLQLDPEEAYAHASLAALAMRRADHEAAVEHITEARRVDPQNLLFRLQEARIRRESGDPRTALELLVALDARTRIEEAVTAEIAACYTSLDLPAKAGEAWEQRYRVDPRHPTAWRAATRAAHARLKSGERDRALFLYQRALLLAPQEAEVRALGRIIEESH
jgi:predicted Zn-dependent protease